MYYHTMLRITATIPDDLVSGADGRAAQLGRSRSWVLSEALRAYLASPASPTILPRDREDASPTPGLGASRQAQLEADLRLTPEERVRAAEQTLREARRLEPPSGQHRVILFDSFDDYLEWDRRDGIR